jgi:hypothetical protein
MTNTKELLFLETDGSCACCGIKDIRVLTIHHIIQTEPKDESYDNKLLLCHNCHQSHHEKKGLSDSEILKIKKRLIIKTLTRPGLNALKESYRHGVVFALPFLVNHLIEFGYLQLESEVETWEDFGKKGVIKAQYSITNMGGELLAKWKL